MRSPEVFFLACWLVLTPLCYGQDATRSSLRSDVAEAGTETEEIVVTATRLPIPQESSPATISVIDAEEIERTQTRRVADALREVPGLSIVQTGTPGQLTSLFTRGLRSEHTQVLLDGIPLNQGLAGLFNFADFTVDNIDRIEVVRGPQSTLYGPRALAGVVQIFTKRGSGQPTGSLSAEAGSFGSFREAFNISGSWKQFDYSVGLSRFDTDNDRPNNQYRNSNAIADVGWSPNEQLRIGSLFTYSLSDTGNPGRIDDPKPFDNLLTERWLIAPHFDFKPVEWWHHKLIVSYDHERQVNDPNEDFFVGPTRSLFKRTTVDYQNDLQPLKGLTFTTGFFYSEIDAGQERPFISQTFGAQPTFISDFTRQTGVFAQLSATPFEGMNLVAGGRYDHFNQFGDVYTYRVAGSYLIKPSDTTVHSSIATGFSPPSPQDKIFGNNPNLDPERNRGFDIGVEQRLWNRRAQIGATYFHNRLTNVIGFNGLFETLNLGAARTQGLEFEARVTPLPNFDIRASYTYLDAEKTSAEDVSQLLGARLPRRPRNEGYISASYLWFGKLRTTAAAKFVNAREEINFGGPNFDIEDYAFVNLAAEYEVNKHLTVFARIDNLTDEKYSEVFGYPALGRAAFGGLKVSF
ncbi:MAG: TonB-dependent receptor [Verrucomicrobiota bacterium]|nr:TonB-dependent receptor [Verrucomicrobiota bacterium]